MTNSIATTFDLYTNTTATDNVTVDTAMTTLSMVVNDTSNERTKSRVSTPITVNATQSKISAATFDATDIRHAFLLALPPHQL